MPAKYGMQTGGRRWPREGGKRDVRHCRGVGQASKFDSEITKSPSESETNCRRPMLEGTTFKNRMSFSTERFNVLLHSPCPNSEKSASQRFELQAIKCRFLRQKKESAFARSKTSVDSSNLTRLQIKFKL